MPPRSHSHAQVGLTSGMESDLPGQIPRRRTLTRAILHRRWRWVKANRELCGTKARPTDRAEPTLIASRRNRRTFAERKATLGSRRTDADRLMKKPRSRKTLKRGEFHSPE